MSDASRSMRGGERVAFWALLALSLLGFAGEAASLVRQWHALDNGGLSAFSSNWLSLTTGLLVLAAWALAVVLSVRLRRWGWLVACVLLFVALPVFAIAMLVEDRTAVADGQQQASFEAAMARALAEQEAERPLKGG